jgi:uncharacterized OB-fold protein
MALAWHLPVPDAETKPFWDAAAEGKLLYQHCTACGHDYHYPRARCPRCWSDRVEWREASGKGTIYTYTIVRENPVPPFRDRVPYPVAIVELAEGPRMMSAIVDTPLDTLHIGMPVEVVFEREGADESGAGGIVVPRFRAARSG